MRRDYNITDFKFDNEHHQLHINLLLTVNWINHKEINFLKKYDISPQQLNILRILENLHPQPATVNLLINNTIYSSSNASRLVEKLRMKGLVKRTRQSINRRTVDIILTEKGLEFIKEIKQYKWIENTLGSLSPDEAGQLNNLLNKLRS